MGKKPKWVCMNVRLVYPLKDSLMHSQHSESKEKYHMIGSINAKKHLIKLNMH